MGKYGCCIGYWWIIFNVVIISYLQPLHSKTSSLFLFVDGKGYGDDIGLSYSSSSSSKRTSVGKDDSTGVWWSFYAYGGQRYNNNNKSINVNSNRRTTTTNTTTSSDSATTSNTDGTENTTSKASKASTILSYISLGLLVIGVWIIPCYKFIAARYGKKFDEEDVVCGDEPASGIYVVEYMEPSPFPIYQEILLNFDKNRNGSYMITGKGLDRDGRFDIRTGYSVGYSSRLCTGFTTWETCSESNPDQGVFTSGTFDFTNHTFKGTWTAKNGNTGAYKYFFHKTLGNNNNTSDSVTTSSSSDTNDNQNPPAVLVHPNDVVVINNKDKNINNNDDRSPTARSEAIAINISNVTAIASICIE